MDSNRTSLLQLNRMARRLGVTQSWLRNEADMGRVPCLHVGNRYLFAPEAVEQVLAERAGDIGGFGAKGYDSNLNRDTEHVGNL